MGADHLTEVVVGEVEAGAEVREKVGVVEEDYREAAAESRRRMVVVVEHRTRQAVKVIIFAIQKNHGIEYLGIELTGAPYGVDP